MCLRLCGWGNGGDDILSLSCSGPGLVMVTISCSGEASESTVVLSALYQGDWMLYQGDWMRCQENRKRCQKDLLDRKTPEFQYRYRKSKRPVSFVKYRDLTGNGNAPLRIFCLLHMWTRQLISCWSCSEIKFLLRFWWILVFGYWIGGKERESFQ